MLFTLEDVCFESRSVEVVNHASFEVEEGSVTEFHGPSGGGKSTLMKLVAGILVPSSGKVCYNSQDIQQMTRQQNLQFRKDCAFVFQDSALWANQTIAQNMQLPLQIHFPEMHTEERMEKVKAACGRVGYDRDLNFRPADLSAGEQKKIALARALISEPKTLFLDECTASLDDKSVRVVSQILHEYISEGNTIMYISHSEQFRWEFSGILFEVSGGTVQKKAIDLDDLR